MAGSILQGPRELRVAISPGESGTSGKSLSGEMLAFHFLPTRHMHPSWWMMSELPEGLFERLAGDRRSHRHLSRRLFRESGLEPLPQLDLSPDAIRLAVMDGQRLCRLLTLAGITLLSPAIAGVLRREERQRIKNGIGADDFQFAVKRGRFLLQQSHLGNLLPAVPPGDPGTVGERCHGLGMGALAAALSDTPDGLVRRMQMKFPKASVERHWRPVAAKPSEFRRLFTLLDRRAGVE